MRRVFGLVCIGTAFFTESAFANKCVAGVKTVLTSVASGTGGATAPSALGSNPFRVMTWNVQDFLSEGSSGIVTDAELTVNHQVAKTILATNPHVLVMNEVKYPSELPKYVEKYLGDAYEVQGSNIRPGQHNVVFLVRKNLGGRTRLEGFRDQVKLVDPVEGAGIFPGSKVFFREVLALDLYRGTQTGEAPFLTVVGLHLKASGTKDEIFARTRNDLELTGLQVVIEGIRRTRGRSHPIVLAGDFNQHLQSESLHKFYAATGYVNSRLQGKDQNRQGLERTFLKGSSDVGEFDGILVSSELPTQNYATEIVVPYGSDLGANGRLKGRRKRGERHIDHAPVLSVINLEGIGKTLGGTSRNPPPNPESH